MQRGMCSECRFRDIIEKRCHLNPPQVTAVVWPGKGIAAVVQFPEVNGNAFCWQFEPVEPEKLE